VDEHLGERVDDINKTASAGMLDDLNIAYVLRLRTPRAIHLDIESDSRLPAHITSIGRVLLADLHPHQLDRCSQRAVIERYTPLTITEPKKSRAEIASVREKGYSVVMGEVDEGVCGVAMPLREQSGRVIAAVGVGLTRARATNDDIQNRIFPRMKSAVDSIRSQIYAWACLRQGHLPHLCRVDEAVFAARE
jgi:IclR family pca regulon transcriptional regulator